ncbi:MAG: NTP pyrophosphohydrolases including oxidative damage repair enzyme [Parcubacteria group bacterium GW2011_GWA2_50_10b]|nr:MAG: NTP pyrophosphohydrolases including oxidative damage repair enzyme [Parcubacteria group bacterium GW2011_GWA2_50_10b]
MKNRVKVGNYKTVFKGTIYEIKQAKAVFPSGKIKTFEIASRPPSVSILAFDHKRRLLLTREYRVKYKKYLWRIPAGRVDKGEQPIKAAQRELQEETGYKARNLKLFHFTDMGQSLDWKRYTYLATGLAKSPLNGDEDEDITVVPTTLPKAYKMVKQGKIKNEGMAYLIFKLYHQKIK